MDVRNMADLFFSVEEKCKRKLIFVECHDELNTCCEWSSPNEYYRNRECIFFNQILSWDDKMQAHSYLDS